MSVQPALPDLPEPLIDLASEIVRTGHSLFVRGYVHGTTGNISSRVQSGGLSGYLITPTDASLGTLVAQRLAFVNLSGEQLYGDRASKTLQLHRAIYAAQAQAHAVIHTHSHHLVLLTLLGVWRREQILPPITPYQVMKVGPVPLIDYAVPGASEVIKQVSAHIANASAQGGVLRAVMCDRLGPQVWHTDLTAAMATLEELEQTARLWMDSGRAIAPLSPEALRALTARFGCVWPED